MTLEQFIEKKIEIQSKKIRAYKNLWENEIRPKHCEEISDMEEIDNATFSEWDDEYDDYTNSFGQYFFNGEKFIDVEE